MEFRAVEKGKEKRLMGYAATYDTLSKPIPGKNGKGEFREKIKRGAFDEVMASKPDVICTLNHDPNLILGRTTSGTLKLSANREGLLFDCLLPNTSYAINLYEAVKRGDMNSCSFAFSDVDDQWSEDSAVDYSSENYASTIKRFILRTISKFRKLIDVSIVTNPAYSGTTVSARNLVAAAEFRSSFANELWQNATPSDRLTMWCQAHRIRRSDYTTDAKGEFIYIGWDPAEGIRRRKMLLNSVLV